MKSLVSGLNNRKVPFPASVSAVAKTLPCPVGPPTSLIRVVDSLSPDSKIFDTWNFDGGYITGWTQVGINSDGTASFRGHFHDSGPEAYNYVAATALLDVKDSNGNTLVFAHSGTVHGTFEIGSRDDDFQQDSSSCLIASSWSAAQNTRTYSNVHTSGNVLGVLETIVEGMLGGLGLLGIVIFGSGVASAKNVQCKWSDPSEGAGFRCEW